MAKYICLCGDTFKTKEISDLHLKIRENDNSGWPHQIMKKRWQSRFLDWFFTYNWGRFFRFTGLFMVYFVFVHHFHIDWSWWEATLIGIGLGLYVE